MRKSIKYLLAIGNTLLSLYTKLIVLMTDGKIGFATILYGHLSKTSLGKTHMPRPCSIIDIIA